MSARSIVNTLRASFGFRLRLGKKRISAAPPPSVSDDPVNDTERSLFSPSSSSDDHNYDYDSESEAEGEGEGDLFVWDVPNPFAPPDPSEAYLHSLIQAQIAEMRRYESIGPLQSLPDQDQLDYWDESESESDTDAEDVESESEGRDDDDDEDYDTDEDHEDGDDADDADDEDSDDDDDDKPNMIVLPQLLPIPLRFFPSPQPNPPPPPPHPTPSSDTASTDDEDPSIWADLAQVYNNLAEAEEVERKAKRDAHRSRLKAIALLGPEASSAII